MMKRSRKNKLMKVVAVMLVQALVMTCKPVNVYAGKPFTGESWEYVMPDQNYIYDGDHTIVEKKVSMHFETVTDGVRKVSYTEWRIDPYCAEKIWFGPPQFGGCSRCKEIIQNGGILSIRVFLLANSL